MAVSMRARELAWFPKVESVAIGILGYVCEEDGDGKYTIEDIVVQLGCNAASANAGVYHLRKVGYVERRKASHRVAMKNPKWGRNLLYVTPRGRARYARHEEDLKREAAKHEKGRI